MSFSSTAAVFPQQAFLNPGPAPVPPSEDGSNNNSKQRHTPSNSDSSSGSPNTSPVTNSGSATSLTHPRREDSKGKVMKQGWVSVKEDGSMKFMWTKKFLVLRDGSLDFLKNEVSDMTRQHCKIY